MDCVRSSKGTKPINLERRHRLDERMFQEQSEWASSRSHLFA